MQPQIQTMYLSRHVLILLLLFGAAKPGWCSNFSFPSFPKKVEGELKTYGQAYIVEDALQVTTDIRDSIQNRVGRIFYKNPIKLWKKGRVASFNSTFVLKITPESIPPGEGLAFILTKYTDVPENSMGQWLGIVNAQTNGSSQNNIVAVEFDTKKSFPRDHDNNHVGVNINSINSMESVSLNSSGIILANGTFLTAMILYNGQTKTMSISVFQGNFTGAERPVLSVDDLDVTQYLPQRVYVGFSASTGPISVERNCILQWYFTIDDIGEDSGLPRWGWGLISVGIAVSFCGVCGFCYLCYKRKNRQSNSNELPIFSGVGPKKFKLKDLRAATSNFNQKYEVGRGGFGIVYKGILKGQSVAVKRVKDTPKGKENLIAEVTTIGSLHHKNVVELIGWCYEGSELLLVYEYMHNRSLDKLLYCNNDGNSSGEETTEDTKLSWNKRYNIICGVAQALDYLHNECLKRVLHRDIKASNIMLDAEFNARLGDFGLARMFKLSEKTHHSTKEIAGTPGYMAPELFHTGKATTETDVFAFGVLALVVASGRKAGVQDEQNECSNNIIDWVWELYSLESITAAIDPKLKGNFDKLQAKNMLELGLACCHPNPNIRPSIGHILQVLIGEAILPSVPSEKPSFVWPAPSPSYTDHQESYSGGMLSTVSSFGGR